MKEAVRKGKPCRPFLHREQQVFTQAEWGALWVCLEQGKGDSDSVDSSRSANHCGRMSTFCSADMAPLSLIQPVWL